ncbi:nodulation protein NodH [Algirhabdus cladophorae]|uniref:nodulation protein NodH n=1 Tax=Algirhabdus cladophorae TaxID=3377108 RepID=UPI003B84911E
MTEKFDYFVLFAEMRTGSNFLEANLNQFDGLTCHGEAFNPHFIGYPDRADILGVTQAVRERSPEALIAAIKGAEGKNGFRFFHDHDARVFDICMADPRCAKIVLTRNPVESYVSWRIATQTGQWKLTNVTHAKSAQITFDQDHFDAHLGALRGFQLQLMRGLQTTGQSAFYIAYEDIPDVDVLNGLGQFLGVKDRLKSLSKKLKKQNPASLEDKVANFDQMKDALGGVDHFDLGRTPNFEPRRGPNVPSYVAAAKAPLLYLPLRGGPDAQIKHWLAKLDDVGVDGLQGRFNQNSLRQWKKAHPGHLSFSVLRHPLARAHAGFCAHILSTGAGSYPAIRETLQRVHNVPLPAEGDAYSLADHRAAFTAYLHFLKANLNGQTSVRVDPVWASQSNLLQGMGEFALPDVLVREDALEKHLERLTQDVGWTHVAAPQPEADTPFTLADIYDDALEALCQEVYQRDYVMFGFEQWQAS